MVCFCKDAMDKLQLTLPKLDVAADANIDMSMAMDMQLLANWLGQHHAAFFEKQLDHGGLLLWVRARSAAQAERAARILGKHCSEKVHVHAVSTGDSIPA